jgi:hypothetical protein
MPAIKNQRTQKSYACAHTKNMIKNGTKSAPVGCTIPLLINGLNLPEAQDNFLPLVGLQPKGQVSVLRNLGFAVQALQFRAPRVFAHHVLGSVGHRNLRLCVGIRIANGICDEEICLENRTCAGGDA